MDVYHTAIRVSDLAATRSFYEDGLGLSFDREFEDDGIGNYFVSGETDAQIQFRYDLGDDSPVEPAGIDHLALRVDDIEATFVELVERTGCPVLRKLTGKADDPRTAFVRDPDGYAVELLEFAE